MGDPDHRTLPELVRTEDTVAGVDDRRSPGPDDVHNLDHHAATRDD